MDDHIARLQEMLKCERTKSSRLQLRCNHQEAELRRREQSMSKMKERLSLFTDRHKDRGPSIKILNTLKSAQGKREQPPSTRKLEEEALHLMLERREAELREAMKLRHSLASLLHALRCDMEQTLSELERSKDGTFSVDKRLDQAERALGDHVTGGVVQSWRLVQKTLGTFTCEGITEFGTDHDKLVAQLESELKQSQQLIQMQQQLLQDNMESPVPSEEWGRLRDHWAEFEHQKRTFERERGAFTDAAIRLSHERHDFEQMKASLLKQQFLCDSPVFDLSGIKPLNTPESAMALSPAAVSKSGDVTGDVSRLRVRTPSTPELYSALSLYHNP